MNHLYKFVRTGLPFIGPFLTIFGLGMVFQVTLHDVTHAAAVIVPKVANVPISWLTLTILAVYFTCQSLRYRGVVLSILDLTIDLYIEEADGRHVRVVLRQEIRPHREDVTGYLRKLAVSGTMPKERFTMDISHATKQDRKFDGTPSHWEIIHTFEGPIPVNPLRLGFDKPVTRTEEYFAVDSYMADEESHEIAIPREYRYERLRMAVHFHKDRPLEAHDCSAIRISASGVSDVRATPFFGQTRGVEIKVKRPHVGERYRLTWKRKANWTAPGHEASTTLPQPAQADVR